MSLKNVEVSLADYADEIAIEVAADCIIVRKTRYDPTPKGKETWSKINEIVKQELGGEWVSRGKDSHWKIPSEDKPGESYFTIRCPYCSKVINFTVGTPKEVC